MFLLATLKDGFSGMYVCLCNGLTDRQVRCAAKAGCSAAGVHRSLGVRPKCGKCLPMMREIVRDLAQETPDGGLASAVSPA
ncbi:MAG TPA: (2Fe-2S)-binding protein [Stellaceae bacterium]|nr:(2Fe-2S)-binding protein [Stellaceae bacterium]